MTRGRNFRKAARVMMVMFLLGALVATLYVGVLAGVSKKNMDEADIWQKEHLANLRKMYAEKSFVPVDWQKYASFDLQAALDGGVKYNEVQFLATHNSYKAKPGKELYFLKPITAFQYKYYFDTLTNQLNSGIFSFELDFYPTKGGFICAHKTFGDTATYCYDFSLAIEELKLWSDNNPGHLPVTIMIEAKGWDFYNKDAVSFDGAAMKRLDKMLSDIMEDKLFAPSDMLEGYTSLAASAKEGGWPDLKDMKDKFVFMLTVEAAYSYIEQNPDLSGAAMFPLVETGLTGEKEKYAEYRAFAIVDNVFTDTLKTRGLDSRKGKENVYEYNPQIKEALDGNCFIRVRLDTYGYYDPDAVAPTVLSGGNILSTDYPENLSTSHSDYKVKLNGYTVFLR